jgi:hypothetical protein
LFKFSNNLPSTSLVAFEAFRANQFNPLWIAETEGNLQVDDYAIALPIKPDGNRVFLSRHRVNCEAERYGGQGLGSNGGGARCGNVGGLQIKGIGANQLAGEGTDYFHSYGGMGLAEGILEAIWGEVLAAALPYGASRTKFIIGLPDFAPVRYPVTGGPKKTRRILTGRNPILRPAHFMRAVGFHSCAALGMSMDAERTKKALIALPNLNVELEAALRVGGSLEATYQQTLTDFLDRLAAQIATARALRIMHGSITESNVGMNGEWLDFTSASALSGYGRIILPRGAPNFLNEEDLIRKGLFDLCFYVNKFVFGGRLVVDAKSLDSFFMSTLRSNMRRQWVKLTGMLDADLDAVPAELHDRVAKAISAVALHGATSSFTILSADNNERIEMPKKLASFDLNDCLARTGWLDSFEEIQVEIAKEVGIPSLRDELAAALAALRAFHAEQLRAAGRSLDEIAIKRAISAFDCIRRNLKIVPLYRTNLHPAVDKLAQYGSAEEVSAFIRRNTELGINALSKVNGFSQVQVGQDVVEVGEQNLKLNGASVPAASARRIVETANAALSVLAAKDVL